MKTARQRLRRFGRTTGVRTRSAADYSITTTLSVVPDPLKSDEWFPQLTFVWENLYYSCCRNGTCGCHKDRVLSRDDVDLLIDPCVDNPEDFIQFTYDGGVDIRSGLDELKTRRAKLTISTFGLPNPKLVELRRNALKAYEWLKALSSDQIDDYLANLPDTTPFITAIYHYFGKRYVS